MFSLEDEDPDVWPGFVDVMTSVVTFLLLGFVAVVLNRDFEKKDRQLEDRDRAAMIGSEATLKLADAIRAAGSDDATEDVNDRALQSDDCERKGWEITCTFRERLRFDTRAWRLASNDGWATLERFGLVLKDLVDADLVSDVVVEGHTDPRPMRDVGRDMTNWELSTARAGHVVRFLVEKVGLPGDILQAVGFAEFRPPNGDRSAPDDQQRFVAIRIRLKGSIAEGAQGVDP